MHNLFTLRKWGVWISLELELSIRYYVLGMSIKSFTDLETWRVGHKFVLQIYKVTEKFPQKEIYALIDQMRRSATSITSNIAEGFSKPSAQDKKKFYYIALGSLTEIQNQLLIARDLGYLNKILFDELAIQSVSISKLINSLIKSAPSHT